MVKVISSGRVLDSRPRGRGFEPQRRHCVVSLSKNIKPSLLLVQPRKTRPYISERLLIGRIESNLKKLKPYHKELLLKERIRSKFLPLREVTTLKRDAIEENHCLIR